MAALYASSWLVWAGYDTSLTCVYTSVGGHIDELRAKSL